MFNIAICDDEKYFIKEFKELVSDYMLEHGYAYSIDTFCSGEEFLSLGIEMLKYTVVFLDINMDELDGITTALKIREVSKDIFIVFVTAYVEYTLEGYKVNAIRYLLKDNRTLQSMLNECMNAIVESMNYKVIKKTFEFSDGKREVSLDTILYIESKLHKLEFHVMEGCMTVHTMYATLNEIEEELVGTNFVRIHQSFLVNLKYIKNVSRYKVVLTNGKELIIPKVRYTSVKERFIAYQGEV